LRHSLESGDPESLEKTGFPLSQGMTEEDFCDSLPRGREKNPTPQQAVGNLPIEIGDRPLEELMINSDSNFALFVRLRGMGSRWHLCLSFSLISIISPIMRGHLSIAVIRGHNHFANTKNYKVLTKMKNCFYQSCL
jgi:hypothetical protein